MNAVLDTNILIDYGRGILEAKEELQKYDQLAISIITVMEVLVGLPQEIRDSEAKRMMSIFDVVNIDLPIALLAADLRATHRIRLPDAIIWATAKIRNALLVTRNTKDFPANTPGVRIPYKLGV